MKLIKRMTIVLGIIGGFALAVPSPSVGAIDVFPDACSGTGADTAICKDRDTDNISKYITIIVNILLYILGAVSVLVIIISGIYYVISLGDSSAIAKAKNTLLYAVIGLIVALLAYAIVNFVLGGLIA